MQTRSRLPFFLAAALTLGTAALSAAPLKLHGIFANHMVLQRDKPITVWGWADAGDVVAVQLGGESMQAKASGDGRWTANFAPRPASAQPMELRVTSGDEKIEMSDILVGDVWVMSGQSNMAFALDKVAESDMEAAQADLPLLRFFSIDPNEQAKPHEDIPAEKIATQGWAVSKPETAREFSAIGYVFGSRVQRSLGIPIGVIKNSRGGASIESIVPSHKFDEHPLAKRYADSVRKRMAEFDPRAKALEIWQNQTNRAKSKGLPEDKWPKKPEGSENLTSWNIPGMSPSDMGSVHNGMFGVFKGYNIKGVLFHQGFNNALSSNCRPKLYRVLMKLMVEGWREDFNDPALPVGVIGFCAGGDTQNEDNFEVLSHAGGPYIRESQRLGLTDVGDPEFTAYIPADDVQVPGLHPSKKREHGDRAARWALAKIYGQKGMRWESASLVSAKPQGDGMILTFDKGVMPDDRNSIPRGFSIAGEDGKFYMAHARYQAKDGQNRWTDSNAYDTRIIHVWSPLVAKPVAVRYGWATSPMGNLKVAGQQSLPLQNFRTDAWDWPESDDPEVSLVDRSKGRDMDREANERLEYRRSEEAKRGVEILERIKVLGRTKN
jgi:sialate O-acetylesterase